MFEKRVKITLPSVNNWEEKGSQFIPYLANTMYAAVENKFISWDTWGVWEYYVCCKNPELISLGHDFKCYSANIATVRFFLGICKKSLS